MRLDRIYTKVGDKGTTHLATGQKVSKAAFRIEAYGCVDELNSHIGFLRDLIRNEKAKDAASQDNLNELAHGLLQIQHELFDLGAELATPLQHLDSARQRVVTPSVVARLEQEIDGYNSHLAPLENFILPGGHPVNSQAHVARCVCRRAERCVVRLSESESVRDDVRIYLNRLSDWLFIACRISSQALGCEEVLWKQAKVT